MFIYIYKRKAAKVYGCNVDKNSTLQKNIMLYFTKSTLKKYIMIYFPELQEFICRIEG